MLDDGEIKPITKAYQTIGFNLEQIVLNFCFLTVWKKGRGE